MKLQKTIAFVFIGFASIGASDDREVAYPSDFRRWTHVTSGYIGEEHPAHARYGGIHHIHANDLALTGYRTGIFPVGSVLTFDVHAVKKGFGTIDPTSRKLLDVMEKRSNGWRFVEFDGDSRTKISVTGTQAVEVCATCHKSAPRDHVFSSLQD
jgi:Cytochrome P460